ncbi:CU044_5270 family protein [Saccharopolyspora shandongensis]|uniref:CU044_5270 family protein n=1 Tax=Saccharopolyspora shandongensis TaxID=418495 RepID=UPI0033DCDF88
MTKFDETQPIRDSGRATELPGEPARDRLATAPAAMRQRPLRRLAWPGAVAVGLTAAISGVLTLAPFGESDGGTLTANAESALTTAAPVLPDHPPRPDQFVYTKSQSAAGIRETWLSTDGTRDGLIVQYGGETELEVPRCGDSKTVTPASEEAGFCTPVPGHRYGLPTDAAEMLDYLKARSSDPNSAWLIGEEIRDIVAESYVRPESRAAVFEAATKVPGISVVEDAKDAIGRAGVGISFPKPDGENIRQEILVFAPTTYAYLGSTFSGQVETAFVDEVRQRP